LVPGRRVVEWQRRILSGLPVIPPGSPVVSIGGAGIFDGVFLTGLAPL